MGGVAKRKQRKAITSNRIAIAIIPQKKGRDNPYRKKSQLKRSGVKQPFNPPLSSNTFFFA